MKWTLHLFHNNVICSFCNSFFFLRFFSVSQLASLSTAQEHHAEALESLEQARRIAEREGHRNELRRINCLIGVSKGTMEFIAFTEAGASFNDGFHF